MAEKIGAERAEAWGLCDEVAPPGQALARALELAGRVAAMPPVQVRMCKQGIDVAAKALNHAVSSWDADQYCTRAELGGLHRRHPLVLRAAQAQYTGR